MRLYIGQVERNDRPAKDGVMSVVRLNHKILIKDQVNYTSPFGSTFTPGGRGGFYSMPSPGQYIMYAETDSIAKDFFYSFIRLSRNWRNSMLIRVSLPLRFSFLSFIITLPAFFEISYSL